MKTANEILEEKIWAKWGQTLYTLSDGVNSNTLIAWIRPQILEAMEEYAKQKLLQHSIGGPGSDVSEGGEL